MEFSTDAVLPPGQLRDIVESIAKSPETWQSKVTFDLAERYCVRLHRDTEYEVWLICWDIGQDTLLHDHGGSSGAFTVAKGSLVEDYGKIGKPRLKTRRHKAGKSVGFGPEYLHNLVNVGMEPTVSIHAYSPPLRVMNFYCWLPSGTHHLRAIECDTPEPDTRELEVEAAGLRVAQL
ncbi:cysteine dioxygenase family protein [Kibdelosporangium philippinense]|uniref:Cysteine dioxygenase family protein n=1 Tax=Kibdelosporangium philippinense TaxID=211113 RepID=A0ABS8ZWI5_9PSEU|nr:cysteine dioxygenase family protein [Kibdelosporangium philippinense]MCE7010743.1 cysteine dioxygenase family protein [Kibdelosporangium philippinense]